MIHGLQPLDKLYEQAKTNTGRTGVSKDSYQKYTNAQYLSWKRKVHIEFYRLIKEAGIYVEGV